MGGKCPAIVLADINLPNAAALCVSGGMTPLIFQLTAYHLVSWLLLFIDWSPSSYDLSRAAMHVHRTSHGGAEHSRPISRGAHRLYFCKIWHARLSNRYRFIYGKPEFEAPTCLRPAILTAQNDLEWKMRRFVTWAWNNLNGEDNTGLSDLWSLNIILCGQRPLRSCRDRQLIRVWLLYSYLHQGHRPSYSNGSRPRLWYYQL